MSVLKQMDGIRIWIVLEQLQLSSFHDGGPLCYAVSMVTLIRPGGSQRLPLIPTQTHQHTAHAAFRRFIAPQIASSLLLHDLAPRVIAGQGVFVLDF